MSIAVRELDESRSRRADDRRRDEATALLEPAASGAVTIAFDETGRALSSVGFAALLGETRDAGRERLDLLIGGPDGLDATVRQRADAVVSFGAMTWPHQLVRVMAAEQIYRALTILAGHPYHRA